MKTKLTLFVAAIGVALFGTGCASTEPAFVTDGLVAYYPFNGNAKDESGNGNDGEVKGATLSADRHGKDEKAYAFDGTSFIEVDDSDLLRPSYITISAWIKTSQMGMILSKTTRVSALGEQYYLCYGYGGQPRINFSIKRKSNGSAGVGWQRGLSEKVINDDIPPKKWAFLCATWDGKKQAVYLNGELRGVNDSAPEGGIDNVKGGKLIIGQYHDGDISSFKGSIDNIRIYNRALLQEEVKTLYEWEKPKAE